MQAANTGSTDLATGAGYGGGLEEPAEWYDLPDRELPPRGHHAMPDGSVMADADH